MFNNNLEMNNLSFNRQLQIIINKIETFYTNYEYKYRTNNSGQLNFLRSYTANSSVFRRDILEEAKNILDELNDYPPIDSERLKEYFETKIRQLKNKESKNSYPPHSLIRLMEDIYSRLDHVDFNAHVGISFD